MRLRVGGPVESEDGFRHRVEVYVEWRDAWVGAFVAPDAVYVCPVPFLVIRVAR